MLAVLRFSLVLAVCQACCGCMLFTNGSHTLLTDPLHFPNNINHLSTRRRYRKVAKQFLNDFSCANPELPVSNEYSDGFLDGFTDYVTYGARHSPPALPPRRYWTKEYATPWGYEAIHDWHAGFADGSLEAANSGLREFQMVPSSILLSSMATPIGSEALPAALPQSLDAINPPADIILPELPPREEIPREEMTPAAFAPHVQIFRELQTP